MEEDEDEVEEKIIEEEKDQGGKDMAKDEDKWRKTTSARRIRMRFKK